MSIWKTSTVKQRFTPHGKFPRSTRDARGPPFATTSRRRARQGTIRGPSSSNGVRLSSLALSAGAPSDGNDPASGLGGPGMRSATGSHVNRRTPDDPPVVAVHLGPGLLDPDRHRIEWSLRRLERRIEHQVAALAGRKIRARVTLDLGFERRLSVDAPDLGLAGLISAEVHKDAWKMPKNPLTYAAN